MKKNVIPDNHVLYTAKLLTHFAEERNISAVIQMVGYMSWL